MDKDFYSDVYKTDKTFVLDTYKNRAEWNIIV